MMTATLNSLTHSAPNSPSSPRLELALPLTPEEILALDRQQDRRDRAAQRWQERCDRRDRRQAEREEQWQRRESERRDRRTRRLDQRGVLAATSLAGDNFCVSLCEDHST